MGRPAAGLQGYVRDAFQRTVADIRRSDRFLRMRVAVLAAWCLASLATMFFACPAAGPGNSLGAEVQVRESSESFLGGAQVLVRNESDEVWRDVILTIDGEWRYAQPTLRPREQIVVSTTQFKRGSEALGSEHRPRRVAVSTAGGSHSVDIR